MIHIVFFSIGAHICLFVLLGRTQEKGDKPPSGAQMEETDYPVYTGVVKYYRCPTHELPPYVVGYVPNADDFRVVVNNEKYTDIEVVEGVEIVLYIQSPEDMVAYSYPMYQRAFWAVMDSARGDHPKSEGARKRFVRFSHPGIVAEISTKWKECGENLITIFTPKD